MANDDILNNLNADPSSLDKVYNIVYLGNGNNKQVLIDMTNSGDTPEHKYKEGTHTVNPITAAQILDGGEAWSSTGILVTGTCMYNNNTRGDTITADYVIKDLSSPKTFHTSEDGSEAIEGNITDQRGNTDSITIDASTVGIAEEDKLKIYAQDGGENKFVIPQGAYGLGMESPSSPTTITITGFDSGDIRKGKHIFGVEGTLNDQILPVEEYYKQQGIHYVGEYEYELQDTTAYAGMLKVKIPAIPLTEEQPAGSTAYTLYIGQSNP